MKKWIIGSTIAVAAIASILFFSTYSLGTTRYVDNTLPAGCSNGLNTYTPTGSGACPGGSATIYSSIANALNAATTAAGDTLLIRAGTYSESMNPANVPIPIGTVSQPITIAAYLSESVTITGGINIQDNINASVPAYLTFDKFTMPTFRAGGNSHHMTLSNSILTGNVAATNVVQVAQSAGFITVIGCDISGSPADAGGSAYGFYVSTSDNIFDRNVIHDNRGSGLIIYFASAQTVNRNKIRNNIFYNNAYDDGGRNNLNDVILIGSGNDNVVYNNLIYKNNGANVGGAISIGYGGTNNRVYNNTIYGNKGIAITINTNVSNSIIRNNLIYGNDNTIVDYGGPGTVKSNNACNAAVTGCNVIGNPNFVDAGTGNNYHLTAGSPAIGAGCGTTCNSELTAVYTTDFDNNARGTMPWDAGAYEYQSVAGDSMTVVTPSTPWTIGSQQTITWNCIGCTGPIDINIDRANAGTFTESIIQDYPLASDSSYTWTVTGSGTDNQVKIRVRDNDASPTATTANFTIQASSGGGLTKRISDNTSGTKIGDISGTQDTYLASTVPDSNFGGSSRGTIYTVKASSMDYSHGLLRFTGLAQIPTTATVTSVTLGLYLSSVTGATSETVDIRKVLLAATETGATWKKFDGTTNWQTAGGTGALDRNSTISASLTNISSTLGYYSVTSTGQLKTDIQADVTAGTQSWFHLEDSSESAATTIGFSSRDNTNTDQRPYLEVTYTVGSSTITVTEPKSGDVFLSGQTGPARWTSQGISGTVNIDLSRDGGATWETLASGVSVGQPDALLTYNAPTSSNCKVRVTDGNITGTSGTFRIGGTRAGFLLLP